LSVLDSRRDSRRKVLVLGVGTSNTDTAPESRVERSPSVSVVIPALNEAENLPHVLATLPENIYELVLVDGNSLDGTATVARELYPRVQIVGQPSHGKGDALAAGFAACSGDIIVMMDADGSTDGGEIPQFVKALVEGADFAKGSRFMAGGGSEDITPVRQAGNRLLCGLVNRLFRTSYTDLCYGYNAFWTRVLPAISPDCRGFEVETLINIRAAVAGLRIVEVPSVEHCRIHGNSKLRPARDGFRVLKTILGEWRRDNRRQELVPVDPVSASAESSGIV
jgi:glycosyltransferase involved in cell wall biosynthesis